MFSCKKGNLVEAFWAVYCSRGRDAAGSQIRTQRLGCFTNGPVGSFLLSSPFWLPSLLLSYSLLSQTSILHSSGPMADMVINTQFSILGTKCLERDCFLCVPEFPGKNWEGSWKMVTLVVSCGRTQDSWPSHWGSAERTSLPQFIKSVNNYERTQAGKPPKLCFKI